MTKRDFWGLFLVLSIAASVFMAAAVSDAEHRAELAKGEAELAKKPNPMVLYGPPPPTALQVLGNVSMALLLRNEDDIRRDCSEAVLKRFATKENGLRKECADLKRTHAQLKAQAKDLQNGVE